MAKKKTKDDLLADLTVVEDDFPPELAKPEPTEKSENKSSKHFLIKITPGGDAIKGILIKHGINKYSQSEWEAIADFPILKARLESEEYILSEKESNGD